MTPIEMFVGNRSPSLTDQITVNGAPFDLSGSTVKLQMRQVNSAVLKVDAAATITNAATGQVQYNWAALDVDTQGDYAAWWRVTLPSGFNQDSPEFEVAIKAHAATALTLDEVLEHVETGLPESAVERLLVEAKAQVEGRFGTDAARIERYTGGGEFIRLQRPALSISAISELNEQLYPLYTLGALGTDYDLLNNGRTVQRLSRNTVWYWRYWASVVDITYTPQPEQAVRDRVTIDLVKLAVQYSGLVQEQVGGRTGYASWSHDYLKERERILLGVPTARGFRFA